MALKKIPHNAPTYGYEILADFGDLIVEIPSQ